MQAVILAAGYGSRLGKMTGGLPKCLVPIGGRPLIELQLEALADVGIGDVLVVVGYGAAKVREVLGERVEYIENTCYSETNSLYSLWLARDWVKKPFVLLNCDLLFHPSALDRLVAKGGNAMLFDSASSKSQEQTKVVVQAGKLIDLGKDIEPEFARGESLGILCFDDRGAHLLFSSAAALVKNGGKKSWVIEAIRTVCFELEMAAINVAGSPWAEIDFPSDLERAQNEVWPAINKSSWRKTFHWKKTKYIALLLVLALFVVTDVIVDTYLQTGNHMWTNQPPAKTEEVFLTFPSGLQKWWMGSRKEQMRVSVTGPTKMRVELRLLLIPGEEHPVRYVAHILMNGKPHAWDSFEASPETEIAFSDPNGKALDLLAARIEMIDFKIPEGTHVIDVELPISPSENFLARIRYPELLYPYEN